MIEDAEWEAIISEEKRMAEGEETVLDRVERVATNFFRAGLKEASKEAKIEGEVMRTRNLETQARRRPSEAVDRMRGGEFGKLIWNGNECGPSRMFLIKEGSRRISIVVPSWISQE